MGRAARRSLEELGGLSVAQLKEEWARCYSLPAPNLSASLLKLGIAYRQQEKRHGGISRETKRILLTAPRSANATQAGTVAKAQRKLTPGTRLVRDWHGIGHTVTVLENGFEYDCKTWRSLTAIAKAITGSHRNGPLFFGLTR